MNQEERDDKKLHFKVILLGNTSVGKSSLLNRYTKEHFSEEYDATIGVEFGTRTIMLQGGVSVKLMIWDTAGQESFRSIIRTYYRNVSAVFLVFDLSDRDSLKGLRDWILQAKENVQDGTAFILVGNKMDLQRKVSSQSAESFKRDNKLDAYLECSAKTATGVNEVFKNAASIMVARKLVKHVKYEQLRKSDQKQKERKEKQKCAC